MTATSFVANVLASSAVPLPYLYHSSKLGTCSSMGMTSALSGLGMCLRRRRKQAAAQSQPFCSHRFSEGEPLEQRVWRNVVRETLSLE
jgi:hypothetical protein